MGASSVYTVGHHCGHGKVTCVCASGNPREMFMMGAVEVVRYCIWEVVTQHWLTVSCSRLTKLLYWWVQFSMIVCMQGCTIVGWTLAGFPGVHVDECCEQILKKCCSCYTQNRNNAWMPAPVMIVLAVESIDRLGNIFSCYSSWWFDLLLTCFSSRPSQHCGFNLSSKFSWPLSVSTCVKF